VKSLRRKVIRRIVNSQKQSPKSKSQIKHNFGCRKRGNLPSRVESGEGNRKETFIALQMLSHIKHYSIKKNILHCQDFPRKITKIFMMFTQMYGAAAKALPR